MREPDRVARLRTRVSTTVVGDLGQRYGELKLMNQAWILSALTLMMFVPALIAMGALLPLGSEHGLAAAWARHLGLSRAAAHDVRLLFRSDHTVQGASTVIG